MLHELAVPTGAAAVARGGRFVPWVLALGGLDFGLEQFMVVPILPAGAAGGEDLPRSRRRPGS